MGSYRCLKCPGLVDINRDVDGGKFFSEVQFRYKKGHLYIETTIISGIYSESDLGCKQP